MSDYNWEDLFDRLASLPEGSQARVRCGSVLLMIERRGDVLLALRELPPHSGPAFSGDLPPGDPPWQVLRFAHTHYLCAWRRRPTHLRWLKDLAELSLRH